MCGLLKSEALACVLDATHPYAVEATKNAARAAKACNIPYLRVLREAAPDDGAAVIFETAAKAAAWLEEREGNILLTTGSKDLGAFSTEKLLPRIFARVLPAPEALVKCEALGLSPSQIVAIQGPVSQEVNEAFLRYFDAKFLVTKNSGAEGGFEEKRAAAKALGATLVVIARKKERGTSVSEAVDWAMTVFLRNAMTDILSSSRL